MNALSLRFGRGLSSLAHSQVVGPFGILLLLFIIASFTTNRFFTTQNLHNLGLEMAIVAIIAIGSTLVILTAQIDLSPGSIVALTSMTTGVLIGNANVGAAYTFVLMLLLGAGVGIVNGFFCSYGRIPSFIFTLATMSIYQGLAYWETGGTPIFSLPGLQHIFYDQLAGVPYPFLYVIFLYAVAWAYLRYTRGGRRIYAVGGNVSAARLVGIKVNRVRMKVFVIAGVLSAFGGLLMSAQLDSGSPDYGSGMELQAIAAAVIGGASLFGGQGNVVATLFGATIITVVQNVLNLHAVGTAWQSISTGVIIAAAVGLDMWRHDMGRILASGWSRVTSRRTGAPAVHERVMAGQENVALERDDVRTGT